MLQIPFLWGDVDRKVLFLYDLICVYLLARGQRAVSLLSRAPLLCGGEGLMG